MAACILASTAIMLLAARGSLWFDEVLSIAFTRRCAKAWDVFTLRFDNNHLLNTLYAWSLGPARPSDIDYRLLAVLSGAGTLVTLAIVGGGLVGVVAVVLAGTSYPLVLYWSEARGYGPAMFCAVVAFALVRRRWTASGPVRIVAFWCALALGILSHLTFVLPTVSLIAGALRFELRAPGSWGRRGLRLGGLFAVPLAGYAWLYVTFVRDMRVIGGPVNTYREVAETTATMLLGVPDLAPWPTVATLACLGIVAAGSAVVWRRRAEEGIFYVVALIVAPVALVAATRPELLYFRYFIVVYPFFPLLLAELLGAICRNRAKRWVTAGLLVLVPWVAGHARRLEPLLRFGRGDERGMLRRISTDSPPGEIRVACDNETGLILAFYERDLPPEQTLVRVEASRWHDERPEWLVTRTYRRGNDPPPELTLGDSVRYERLATFRHGGVSGWTSFLWRRDPQQG